MNKLIKVVQVTTHAPERCGLAQYTSDLLQHVEDKDIEFRIMGRPFDGESIISRVGDADVVHIHHVYALFGALEKQHIYKLREMGKKVICTFNESSTENRSEFTLAFDKVIVHQQTVDGFTHIPHGMYNVGVSSYADSYPAIEKFIGTAGFPIGFKNCELVARIAQTVGLGVLSYMPESTHANANNEKEKMNRFLVNGKLHTDFLPPVAIIQELSKCLFTIFPHDQAGGGISGSVRFGLSARRPCIVSRTSRTQDIAQGYEEEVYWIESGQPTFENTIPVVRKLLEDIENGVARVPKKIVEDMDWTKVAAQYVQVYREVME